MTRQKPRHNPKRDANEPEIKRVLKLVGATYRDLHEIDELVGYCGKNFLIEIKVPGEKLKLHQQKFQDDWRGQADTAWDWYDALMIIGAIDHGWGCEKEGCPLDFYVWRDDGGEDGAWLCPVCDLNLTLGED